MITEIGIVAGEIWNFLDKQGEVSLEKLIAGIERPRELTLMSLGWLAREGHVLVGRDDHGYKINLREDNVKSCMKKGVVLIVIIGVMAVIFALALAALHIMTQESRIAEHKIKRTRAFFAAQAGTIDVLEQLRNGTQPIPTVGSPTIYTLAAAVNNSNPDIIVVAKGDSTVFGGVTYCCNSAVNVPCAGQNEAPSDSCVFSEVDY